MVIAVKSLHIFRNLKPNDPNAFKEELKIKLGAMSTIVRKFLNGTGVLEHLPKAETPPQDLGDYFRWMLLTNLSRKRKRTL